MNAEARQTLRELRSLTNIETYFKTARAELASNPSDERLRAFIEAVSSFERPHLALECSDITTVGSRGAIRRIDERKNRYDP